MISATAHRRRRISTITRPVSPPRPAPLPCKLSSAYCSVVLAARPALLSTTRRSDTKVMCTPLCGVSKHLARPDPAHRAAGQGTAVTRTATPEPHVPGRVARRAPRNLRCRQVPVRLDEVGMSGGYCHIVLRLVETGLQATVQRCTDASLTGSSPPGGQPIETRPRGLSPQPPGATPSEQLLTAAQTFR